MWEDQAIHHLRRAVATMQRNSASFAYCFEFDAKSQSIQALKGTRREYRLFKWICLCITFPIFPLFVVRGIHLATVREGRDTAMMFVTYLATMVIAGFLPYSWFLIRAQAAEKYVSFYQATISLERTLHGQSSKLPLPFVNKNVIQICHQN